MSERPVGQTPWLETSSRPATPLPASLNQQNDAAQSNRWLIRSDQRTRTPPDQVTTPRRRNCILHDATPRTSETDTADGSPPLRGRVCCSSVCKSSLTRPHAVVRSAVQSVANATIVAMSVPTAVRHCEQPRTVHTGAKPAYFSSYWARGLLAGCIERDWDHPSSTVATRHITSAILHSPDARPHIDYDGGQCGAVSGDEAFTGHDRSVTSDIRWWSMKNWCLHVATISLDRVSGSQLEACHDSRRRLITKATRATTKITCTTLSIYPTSVKLPAFAPYHSGICTAVYGIATSVRRERLYPWT